MPAIDGDFSVLFQLSPRQLTNQRVEHGAFGKIESIGIVDDGVAIQIELHFRRCDDHLVEHTVHRTGGFSDEERLIEHGAEHFVLVEPRNVERIVCRFIPFFLATNDVSAWLRDF